MPDCKYINKNGTCGLKGCYAYRHKCYTEDCCKCFEPFTNADRIRSMSDDELAKFQASRFNFTWKYMPESRWIEWLKQPAGGEN